jgi:CBS-domain-containing membrane protein
MVDEKVHHILVTSDKRKFIGLISSFDVMRAIVADADKDIAELALFYK